MLLARTSSTRALSTAPSTSSTNPPSRSTYKDCNSAGTSSLALHLNFSAIIFFVYPVRGIFLSPGQTIASVFCNIPSLQNRAAYCCTETLSLHLAATFLKEFVDGFPLARPAASITSHFLFSRCKNYLQNLPACSRNLAARKKSLAIFSEEPTNCCEPGYLDRRKGTPKNDRRIMVLVILKYFGLCLAAASSVWGTVHNLTVQLPNGHKRLTTAGVISIVLTLTGLAVSNHHPGSSCPPATNTSVKRRRSSGKRY